jgi:hypothetical protein
MATLTVRGRTIARTTNGSLPKESAMNKAALLVAVVGFLVGAGSLTADDTDLIRLEWAE